MTLDQSHWLLRFLKIKTDPIFIFRCREFNIELIPELEIDSRMSYSGELIKVPVNENYF